MTAVTVTVAASWRLGRVDISTPISVPASITGYGEVLLQEPETPSKDASIFRGMPFAGGEPGKTYGTMPGAPVSRLIDDVLAESIDVNGTAITFEATLDMLKAFFEKWRAEDAAKPPPTMPAPQGAGEPTPVYIAPPVDPDHPRPGDD